MRRVLGQSTKETFTPSVGSCHGVPDVPFQFIPQVCKSVVHVKRSEDGLKSCISDFTFDQKDHGCDLAP